MSGSDCSDILKSKFEDSSSQIDANTSNLAFPLMQTESVASLASVALRSSSFEKEVFSSSNEESQLVVEASTVLGVVPSGACLLSARISSKEYYILAIWGCQ